jgi:DNA invertase Pin-like site-specific DNA recombinase
MNYRRSSLELREARDRAVVQARRELAELSERRDHAVEQARRDLAALKEARDAEIHRLHDEGLSRLRISLELGCSKDLVYEILNPERHEKYNARRRLHLRAVA